MAEILNPQQAEFLTNYTNPNSETFGNALQSALRAKYSQEYAESITSQMPDWLSENLGDMKRLSRAEKVLDKTLEMETVDQDGKVDNQLLKTQTDVAKFVASTVGKKKYSTRSELTGANGRDLTFNVIAYNDNHNDSTPVQSEELPTSSIESIG